MGNCCGTPDPEPFTGPGRVLGSAPPPQPKTAPMPSKKTIGGPARTLGGGGGSTGGAEQDARSRAAAAAEARAQSKPTGKLGDQLQAQRKQTRTDTLKAASADETRRREMDSAAEAMAHN